MGLYLEPDPEFFDGWRQALEDDEEEGDERKVSMHNRALPLIEMLEAAAREDVPVMWE